MKRYSSAAAVALLGLTLTGCGQKEQFGAVSGAVAGGIVGGVVTESPAGAVVGALVGGLIGDRIGAHLDAEDRRRAEMAEYQALQFGQPGEPVMWYGDKPGYYGKVIPGPYVDGSMCREYTHVIYIADVSQTVRGRACRRPDGTWRIVS